MHKIASHGAFEIKYAPKSLRDYVFADDTVEREISSYVEARSLRPLLLYGPNGTGKTTIAKVLPYEIAPDFQKADLLWITGDRRQSVANTIGKIENFAPLAAFNTSGIRCVVIDEIDNLPNDLQRSLKGHVESYMKHTLFIFTTNRFGKVEPGIKSRAAGGLFIGKAAPERWLSRIREILEAEGVAALDDESLIRIVAASKCDGRKVMAAIQRLVDRCRELEQGSVTTVSFAPGSHAPLGSLSIGQGS